MPRRSSPGSKSSLGGPPSSAASSTAVDGKRKSKPHAPSAPKSAPAGGRRSKSTLTVPTEVVTKDDHDDHVRPWAEAKEKPSASREACRVPNDSVTLQLAPELLPAEPGEASSLFDLVGTVARRALVLGLASREPNFHVFVAAPSGVMIDEEVARFAEAFVATRPAPPDIAYVHDFDRPEAPKPLVLPAGKGPELAQGMTALIDGLKSGIIEVLAGDDLQRAQRKLASDLEARSREVITGLESTAKTLGFGIRSVQGGVQTFPILHGKPVSPEQFAVLDESTRRSLTDAEEGLTREVEKAAKLVEQQSAKFSEVRMESVHRAVEKLIDSAFTQHLAAFADLGDEVIAYFSRVREALLADWEDLVQSDDDKGEDDGRETHDHDPEHATRLGRFKVNPLVTNDPAAPPPVIYDTNPTYPNVFGYLERRARFGALLTDFTRIRAGSLLKASGGVLVVRAADLMADPIIWERMKRVLRERRLGAEDPLGPLGLYATTLRPVPAPITVRVVLVGPPDLYAALLDADPDFAALFRIKVEIEPTMPRTRERYLALDAYLMNVAKEREWGVFDRAARARLLDLSTRLAGERDKLSILLSPLEETAAFASALAAARASAPERGKTTPASKTVIGREDIEQAWRERRERAGAAERHIRELTIRGEIALDTSGSRVGVVNGLSVYSAGDVEFGQPMRITTVVALGREGIVDVEREAQLGGAIHTKGVAILRGYLSRVFGQERPLSIRAQLAFEQSYGEIDGDSASSSETFAVLSALADVPIDQGVAVTGSVNQLGEMQAIGGVCAKIEGFFDLCIARGLDGAQGVLLPRSNLRHLVLREDVAQAVAAGKFHLYAVDSVAQGIEVLTGLPAGTRDSAGRFPAFSVFGRVERRIIEIAERLREAEATKAHAPGRESLEDVSAADLTEGGDFRKRG